MALCSCTSWLRIRALHTFSRHWPRLRDCPTTASTVVLQTPSLDSSSSQARVTPTSILTRMSPQMRPNRMELIMVGTIPPGRTQLIFGEPSADCPTKELFQVRSLVSSATVGVQMGLRLRPAWRYAFTTALTAVQRPHGSKRGSSLASTRLSHLGIAPRLAMDTHVTSGMTTMGTLVHMRRQTSVAIVQVANARVGNWFCEPVVCLHSDFDRFGDSLSL